jgi:ABC-type transport system involved in multi-copper enzyme maturation permease subunit
MSMPPLLRWLLRLGPQNPVAVRIVQNASRRNKHLYIRSAYLALLILVLLWSLVVRGAADYRELAAVGSASFTLIAYLQIILICLLAPVFMAGAIAQEASPRTWEILLTTPLTAAEIVLGNLFGRLFFILALLLAGLPLFALTQYFGGVPGRTILASYAVAASAALLVGAVAIALSVSRLVGKRAVFAFYVAVVTYLAVTAAVDYMIRAGGGGAGQAGQGVTPMTALNPFLALSALLNPSTYPAAEPGTHGWPLSWMLEAPVRTWVIGSSGFSVLLMIVSAATVRAGGLAGAIRGDGAGSGWLRRALGLSPLTGERHRAPRHVWHNPIAWREAAARNATPGRIFARWSFIVLGAAWGVTLLVLFHDGTFAVPDFRFALGATVFTELAVTTLVAVNMAGSAVTREREDGTLDLLLTTPITPEAYLQGKLRGLIAYLLPMLAVPVGTLALAAIYVGTGGLGRSAGLSTSTTVGAITFTVPAVLPESVVLAPLVTVPFLAFVVMLGLQWSLRSRGMLSAIATTFGIVGVITGTLGLCGWHAGTDLQFVGPALAAFSPATALRAMVSPDIALTETLIEDPTGVSARVAFALGCVISALAHAAAVYGIRANMVRTFDMTVRRLAGTV